MLCVSLDKDFQPDIQYQGNLVERFLSGRSDEIMLDTPTVDVRSEFAIFRGNGAGIECWISDETPKLVIDRLSEIDAKPISLAQLNQLLILSHEAGVSEGFFNYYWLCGASALAKVHPYNITRVPDYNPTYENLESISSLPHLKWGLYRFYTDALLFFGNIRQAYRELRQMSFVDLEDFFSKKRFDTQRLLSRGAPLPMSPIAKDDRYLIAEMACKTYDPSSIETLEKSLVDEFKRRVADGAKRVTFRELISPPKARSNPRQVEMEFSMTEVLDDSVSSEGEISAKIQPLVSRFVSSRAKALENTNMYVSMSDDLDVYVATSMRAREDFRKMSDFCDEIFSSNRLKDFSLRYFDPTMSAASGHEDKGLIECLMVKCAKILVYVAGEKESYGKDAEAAMALSQGKPVIFYCDAETRSKFYREVHPLSRPINFKNGVPVGAIVTDKSDDVIEIIKRVLTNEMAYELQQGKPGHFQLCERKTRSIVRLQTADVLLREAFWNYYNVDHRQ
jgi:hypothetical protein